MDLIGSVFTLCSNVSDTDRQYKILAGKLDYEVKKSQHLMDTQRIKNTPKFMVENLRNKLENAETYLEKLQKLISQNRISFKQKIKLSLPFNKTNVQVRTALEQLQKAQQDVNDYASNTQPQNNGKRFIENGQNISKKQQKQFPILSSEDVNDEDIEEAIMGPTVQQDTAIQFTKNKYIMIKVQIHGKEKLLQIMKAANKEFLVYQKKIQIKFENIEQTQKLTLFSLGRIYFKPVYSKLKPHYSDIDRISKVDHFVISLKRHRQNIKQSLPEAMESQKKQNKPTSQNSNEKVEADEFFSFPCTCEQMVMKETDSVIIQKLPQKAVYISGVTGAWQKMEQTQRILCPGDEIAAYMPIDNQSPAPDLFFKIKFQFIE